MKRKSYITSIFLLIAAFIVVAVISEYYFARIDLTEGGQYSLSSATEDILNKLDNTVTVKAYFTADLPPDLSKVKNNFKDMLTEYGSLSHGHVVFQFLNPNGDSEIETEAMAAGIQPVLFNVREKDQVKQQKVFMGAVLSIDDKKEILPFINPDESIEYALTTSIKKLSAKNKATIGFVQGHGEPPLAAFQQVKSDLDVLYNVREVYLSDTVRDLYNFKTLVIVNPVDTFDLQSRYILDSYLNNGGNLVVAFNRMKGNLQALIGEENITGLEQWLEEKGLKVDNKLIVDANCGSVNVSQRTGMFNMTTPMSFPFLPSITSFGDSPITKGIEKVLLGFPSPITYIGDTSNNFVPLLATSDKSGVLGLPVRLDVQKKWTNADFVDGSQVVGALLESEYRDRQSKIVLFTSGDFAVNGVGQRPRKLQPDHVNLLVNSIDWLSDDTGLIDLRTKTITSRPIDQISDAKKMFLKWFNFLLPLLLVIIYGVIRMQMRRNQRVRRMEKGYVK